MGNPISTFYGKKSSNKEEIHRPDMKEALLTVDKIESSNATKILEHNKYVLQNYKNSK
jgi:hypothetical protein